MIRYFKEESLKYVNMCCRKTRFSVINFLWVKMNKTVTVCG